MWLSMEETKSLQARLGEHRARKVPGSITILFLINLSRISPIKFIRFRAMFERNRKFPTPFTPDQMFWCEPF